MSIKETLKTNPLTRGLYSRLKSVKDQRIYDNLFSYQGKFINRSNNADYLCLILAGYKDYLYPAVFSRLKQYAIRNMDICVISSGKYSDELDRMCTDNNWSYLSTEENNVSLVQNVAIKLHPQAKYIFKLDEDIFITEGYFERMIRAYEHAQNGVYFPGVIAPLIPINGYGHVRVLEKLKLVDEYEKRFGSLKCAAGHERPIESSPDVAKFFWGEGMIIPDIDKINALFYQDPVEERATPIRFSIGAILFERSVWEDMGYFSVNRKSVSLGWDEAQLCSYCCLKSRPIMVSENILVGHFSFGPQNDAMKEYYELNKDRFLIH